MIAVLIMCLSGLCGLLAASVSTASEAIANPDRALFNPFSIGIDPMLRLLLINFERDPDSLYIGFEPQVFDDPVNGTGHLVIGWRSDGRVDVYHQAGLRPDPAKFDIAGKGLAHLIETGFDPCFYEVGDRGVDAHYGFRELHGREVLIRIREKHSGKRKPFGLLAPMGEAALKPSAMPLVLLQDFYFVRQKHTEFVVSIDGRRHKPDKLPLLMDWTRMLFSRYSPRPIIATLNPAMEGQLPPIILESEDTGIIVDNHLLELDWSDGTPRIASIVRENDVYPLTLLFKPAFPDLTTLTAGSAKHGSFKISGHPSTGSISGTYRLWAEADSIMITLVPSGGWKPLPSKCSLRFLYAVAGVFRSWPKSYRWEAVLRPDGAGGMNMRSHWRRTGRKSGN